MENIFFLHPAPQQLGLELLSALQKPLRGHPCVFCLIFIILRAISLFSLLFRTNCTWLVACPPPCCCTLSLLHDCVTARVFFPRSAFVRIGRLLVCFVFFAIAGIFRSPAVFRQHDAGEACALEAPPAVGEAFSCSCVLPSCSKDFTLVLPAAQPSREALSPSFPSSNIRIFSSTFFLHSLRCSSYFASCNWEPRGDDFDGNKIVSARSPDTQLPITLVCIFINLPGPYRSGLMHVALFP